MIFRILGHFKRYLAKADFHFQLLHIDHTTYSYLKKRKVFMLKLAIAQRFRLQRRIYKIDSGNI